MLPHCALPVPRSRGSIPVIVRLAALIAGGVAPAAAQVRFHGVGDLPGGIVYSEVRDATKVGGVIYAVGNASGLSGATGGDTAVLWTSTGGLRGLPNLVAAGAAGPFLTASAITPDGRFVASRARNSSTANTRIAVKVATDGLAIADLGGLPGFPHSAATGISADGQILYGFAQYGPGSLSRAVRFTFADRGVAPLPFAVSGHDMSTPAGRGVSADGSVMVGESWNSTTARGDGPGSRAFRYVHGQGVAALPLAPGGTWNGAVAVSPNGSLVLLRGDSPAAPQGEVHLVDAARGTLTRLDTPNGAAAPNILWGLTADGTIVVGNFSGGPTEMSGYVRNTRGWHHLQSIAADAGANLAGWRLDTPMGVSRDGTLVWGAGTHNGNREGWVLEFPAGYLAGYVEPATYSTPGRDVVGAWTMGTPGTPGATVLVLFANGYYFHLQEATAEERRLGGRDGFERGQYSWDAVTGVFQSRPLLDQNGDIGLSPGGVLGTVTVAGDTLRARTPDATITLTRVAGASPIVGAFGVGNVHDGSSVTVFLPSGHYYHAQDGNAVAESGGDPRGQDGIERGTYQWNPATGALTVAVGLDTNGEWGLSHAAAPLLVQPQADGARVREGGGPETLVPRVRAATLQLPAIVAQPASVAVPGGRRAGFQVTVAGTAPFTYQWRKDGGPLPGATAATFALAAVRSDDAGSYTCLVTNAVGRVVSEPAVLTVTRNFAGTYFGTVGGGRGHWGMHVLPDGTGTMILFLSHLRSGIVAPVRVDDRGAFRVGTALLQVVGSSRAGPPRAAVGTPVTLSGTIGAGGVEGAVEGAEATFSGAADPDVGETSALSGFYQATGVGGTMTFAVVGTNRTVAALTVGATVISGGLGTIGANGAFTVVTPDQVAIAGTVTPAGALTGSVAPPAGAPVAVTGTVAETVGPPVIATPPRGQAAVAGAPVTLAVEARGAPLTYQWRKDGRDLAGATGATLAIAAALITDAAEYTCAVTNVAGSVVTPPAVLSVSPYNVGRLVNLSILTEVATPGGTFSLGTVVGGAGTTGSKPLLVRAAGPALAPLGVTDPLSDPRLEAFFGATKVGENDNWGGDPALAAAFAQVGAFGFAAGSRDAAIFNPAVAAGNNSLRVAGVGAATGRVIAELYEATPPPAFALTTPRLVNVSVLKEVGDGFTLGFVIGGDSAPTVLIRAVGPGLAAVGVQDGFLRDPRLTLFAGGTVIEENDNWGGAPALGEAMARVGAFALPTGSLDAAVLATLAPGAYTVQVSGVGGAGGAVIAEVYEVR